MTQNNEKPRLLYIEDNSACRNLMTYHLEKFSVTLDVAVDGDEGLKKLQDASYDLLLLDLKLPGCSGFDIAEYVRKHQPKLPIVVVSAIHPLEYTVDQVLDLSDEFITKPVKFSSLDSTIAKYIPNFAVPEEKYF